MTTTHLHHLKPKHRGGTDADGIVEVSIPCHAMFHYCEWKLWGCWQDRVAWLALTKQINPEEISEEIKQQQYKKISQALSGVPKTEEHKQKTSQANKIAYQNPEVIERCRETRPNKKQVQCVETGEVFRSLAEAARQMNIHRVSIQRSIKYGNKCRPRGSKCGRMETPIGYSFILTH